jgi:hypothetical protein
VGATAQSIVSGAFGLGGVIIGAAITQGVAWWQKRKRHRAYWAAMRAEIEVCRDYASGYVDDQVIAPLYRLPSSAYENGFPNLLGDGVPDRDETKAVIEFYGFVDQINRGLKQADEATKGGHKTDWSVKVSARLDVKCKHLANEAYEPARAVIDKHL